jgi:ABC-type multidrug transport system permease subunit
MSPQEWHELYLQRRPAQPEVTIGTVPPSDQRKPGVLKQFLIFLKRNLRTKVTNLQYMLIALLEAPLLAVVCAFLTRYAPPEGYCVMNNKNLVSYFFMAVIVATFIGMSGSAEEIFKDRALLKREKFLHLSYGSYIWSKIVYMAGVSLLQTFLFVIIGNAIMGLHGLFWVWWLILFVTAFLSNLVGLLLSQMLNSIVAIYITIPMLLIPQILLCGLVVSFSDLAPRSHTGNVPIVGDVIPSRWAYEALAVTQFSDNDYEKPFFETNREKYEAQFYNVGILNELQSQLETLKDERKRGVEENPQHIAVIRRNLPTITAYCEMEPYSGDYDAVSLYDYMKAAERILVQRANKATLASDRMMSAFLRERGKDAMFELKRQNYNIKLQEFVVGADNGQFVDVIDDAIVPRVGQVYLTPHNRYGRAPFYSCEKRLGDWHIKTLWFNMGVLLLMCIFLTVILLLDLPERLRKS